MVVGISNGRTPEAGRGRKKPYHTAITVILLADTTPLRAHVRFGFSRFDSNTLSRQSEKRDSMSKRERDTLSISRPKHQLSEISASARAKVNGMG